MNKGGIKKLFKKIRDNEAEEFSQKIPKGENVVFILYPNKKADL